MNNALLPCILFVPRNPAMLDDGQCGARVPKMWHGDGDTAAPEWVACLGPSYLYGEFPRALVLVLSGLVVPEGRDRLLAHVAAAAQQGRGLGGDYAVWRWDHHRDLWCLFGEHAKICVGPVGHPKQRLGPKNKDGEYEMGGWVVPGLMGPAPVVPGLLPVWSLGVVAEWLNLGRLEVVRD